VWILNVVNRISTSELLGNVHECMIAICLAANIILPAPEK
jgi:hypothetical protein